MLLLAPLAPFVVLATRVVAGPTVDDDNLVSVPITKRISSVGTLKVVQNDNKRSRFLLKGGQQDESLIPDVPLNDASFAYTADIAVGDPPTLCESCQFRPRMVSYILILDQLIVDTGSSNTWVGLNKNFVKTKTSMETSSSFVSIMP
jgi:cathepsin E